MGMQSCLQRSLVYSYILIRVDNPKPVGLTCGLWVTWQLRPQTDVGIGIAVELPAGPDHKNTDTLLATKHIHISNSIVHISASQA